MFTYFVLLTLCLGELLTIGFATQFGYEGSEGPNFWGIKYSECIGKHQSPINIQEHNVEVIDFLPLKYEHFDTKGFFSIMNNGHTAMFTLKSPTMPTITGGPLIGKYEFAQLHFHWGSNDFEGSENRINNVSFPMELHMVFYGSSYGSEDNATQHSDGLAVLSFLYSICLEDNTNYTEVINALPEIISVGSRVELQPLSLEDLTAFDKSTYFTYSGSLTTPPCSEVVTWIEYKETIPLAPQQIQAFRQLNSRYGKLTHNFRPTQPLHGRKIRMNKDIREYQEEPYSSIEDIPDFAFYDQFHPDRYT